LDLTGREIGRYRIQQRLGRSGVTTVYQAYDTVGDVPVALKVLLHGSDAKLYNRFRQEAQTAAKLHHPHIVRTLRVGVTPGSDTAYIAMELVEGEDLAALLSTRRRLSAEESCLLLEPIAHALAYAHSQGVIHRDVKPSNILLRTVSGEVPESVILDVLDYPVVPLLGDFGIARALDLPELTTWGRTVGTPAFMAPEQARGARSVDHRADLYALGAVFYRCITGRQPFIGNTVQILHAHVYDSVTISDEIQRNLSPRHVEILQRTLAKDPKDRYQSALELAADLARGINPRLDELSATEREDGATLTMEMISASEAPAPVNQNLNILIRGVAHGEARPTTTAGDPAAPTTATAASTANQQPLDPNFDPVLDQKLQKWSGIILSVLLTFATVALLFFLLRNPYRVLREMVVTPTSAPIETSDPGTSLSSQSSVSQWGAQTLFSDAATNQRVPLSTNGNLLPASSTVVALTAVPLQPTVDARLPVATPTFFADPMGVLPLSPEQERNASGVAMTATEVPPPTPAPSSTLTVDDELAATAVNDETCQREVAEALRSHVDQLPTPLHASFRCAIEEPSHLQGEFLAYEHGFMLYLTDSARMLVSYDALYNGDGLSREGIAPWEDFTIAWHEDDAVTPIFPPLAPEDLQFYPTRMFAMTWQIESVRTRLGMAITPLPEAVTVILQRFNQGLLVLRLPERGQEDAILYIYPLAARIF